MKYNYFIQGFRGLCASMVFVYHVMNSKIVPGVDSFPLVWNAFVYFTSSFRYGVEMFFMISGYVILGSLRRHANLRAFFADRALRIFPAWTPLHILLFVGGPFVGWGFFHGIDAPHWLIYFAADLFLLPTIINLPLAHPAAWSLSYEWTFYLLAAGGLAMARARRNDVALAVVGTLVVATILNFFPRGVFFIPGVIVAMGESRFVAHRKWFAYPIPALLVFLLAWRATNVDIASIDTLLIEWVRDLRILWLAIALAAGTYLFASVALGEGLSVRILATRLFQFLGNISYSFYLWHPVVMFPVKRLAVAYVTPRLGPWGGLAFFTIVSLAVALVLSWLSWRLFEKRLTRFIKDWLRRPREAPATA